MRLSCRLLACLLPLAALPVPGTDEDGDGKDALR